jgi:ubiquinone/menaquinone biosynthesis C-methylase UbiE
MMPELASPPYKLQFDENNQEFQIIGSLRPQHEKDMADLVRMLQQALPKIRGTLYVNVKRLVRLNNMAFRVLASMLLNTVFDRPDLKIIIITSSVVGWSTKKFAALTSVDPRITVEEYDSEFYPSQTFLEEGGFIPVLRTQTRMTWRHERSILPRHGLKPGMTVADVCCGIGDFAVLLAKEFKPARVVALDHSKSSLAYARRVANDFAVQGIEYVYGDASEMLLEDNQFDFVTCRHALQIFDRPELIISELVRICKPGGRIYVTNEKISHCLGEPYGPSIQWTYNELTKLFSHFSMDLEFGPKSARALDRAGLEDVRIESFMVTNKDGDPQDFADMILAWEEMFAGGMCESRGDDAAFIEKLRRGFEDHIAAALHPGGYAGWPIWVASGRKPA